MKETFIPSGFQPPREATVGRYKVYPLTERHLSADLDAVNSSLDLIKRTRGGSWPSKPVSEEFDFLDLAWHEREFRDAESFAYVIYSKAGQYIGCFYLYPVGTRTALNEELAAYDVDASWRVTTAAYTDGYYEKLYTALQQWLKESFPFSKVHYSNKELPT